MRRTSPPVEVDRYPAGVRGPLEPFSGVVCPYIGFESGHTIWVLVFDRTPTPVGPYAEVWVETPDGESTLYTPSEATDYVTSYHDFDHVQEAAVTWDRHGDERLDVTVDSADGTTLHIDLDFDVTPRTRVLNALTAVMPNVLARTSVGSSVSTLAFNLLLPTGGSKIRGQTETGIEYWADPDRILDVTGARATLDGLELGDVVPSRSQYIHGDVRRWEKPYALVGRLHLEYPAPGHPVTG